MQLFSDYNKHFFLQPYPTTEQGMEAITYNLLITNFVMSQPHPYNNVANKTVKQIQLKKSRLCNLVLKMFKSRTYTN